MTKHFCDRCEKEMGANSTSEVGNNPYMLDNYEVLVTVKSVNSSSLVGLCASCLEELRVWLKAGKEQK